MGFLSWLEASSYANWIAGSAYGWVIMLSLHAVGIATIVGIMFVVNLRLLGLYQTIPCASFDKYLKIVWYGIGLNLFTGLSIFTSQATFYITSLPFLLKITFVIVGSVNLHYTQKALRSDAENWDATGTVPTSGLVLAASSLVFWTMAVVTGRLIAYM